MGHSDTLTQGIRVQATSFYIPMRSRPDQDHYVFGYKIRIANEGETPAQLSSRHWVITDAAGHVEEVRGPGVVGETPRLAPGEAHEYASFCPLPTTSGVMRGAYTMVREDGTSFDVEVGDFRLELPHELH